MNIILELLDEMSKEETTDVFMIWNTNDESYKTTIEELKQKSEIDIEEFYYKED